MVRVAQFVGEYWRYNRLCGQGFPIMVFTFECAGGFSKSSFVLFVLGGRDDSFYLLLLAFWVSSSVDDNDKPYDFHESNWEPEGICDSLDPCLW